MVWKLHPAAWTSGGDPKESVAAMSQNGREAVGDAIVFGTRNASAAVSTPTRPDNNGGSADPTVMDNAQRKNVPYERNGAHYGIQAALSMPPHNEVAPTSKAGRLLSPCTVRSGFKGSSGGY